MKGVLRTKATLFAHVEVAVHKKDRKDKVDMVLHSAIKISGNINETHQAWLRLMRELEFLSDAEANMPRFKTLLHAIHIAATGDQT